MQFINITSSWGGDFCGMVAPAIIIIDSPLIHKNTKTLAKQNQALSRLKPLKERGCIKKYIGENGEMSGWQKDILNPINKSRQVTKDSHELLIKSLQPGFNCFNKGDLRHPSGTKYIRKRLWTIPAIKSLAG